MAKDPLAKRLVPVEVAVPPIPRDVPKYPVLQRSQFVPSPMSKALSVVGTRESANLLFIYTMSVVVASPRVVWFSTVKVETVVVERVLPPVVVRDLAKISPSASTNITAEPLTASPNRLESFVAEVGLIIREECSGFAPLAPIVQEPKE